LALTAHEKIGPPFSGPKLCSESKALILGECCDGRHRYIGWRYRHPLPYLLSHRTSTTCVYLCLYTSPRAANRPCDGRHQKRECDTNFFVCLLVRSYRIDALALSLVCFATHCGSRTVFCHAQRTLWQIHAKAAALPSLRSGYAARSNNVAIWRLARSLQL